jgi:hypothetical protein
VDRQFLQQFVQQRSVNANIFVLAMADSSALPAAPYAN